MTRLPVYRNPSHLSSRIRGPPQSTGTAGFTFQRGNANDLADRLRYLIANPAIREAAGWAARKRIEDHYQWQKIAQDIESVYLEILGKKPAMIRDKKPRSTAITGEELPLRRRAG